MFSRNSSFLNHQFYNIIEFALILCNHIYAPHRSGHKQISTCKRANDLPGGLLFAYNIERTVYFNSFFSRTLKIP